MNNFVTDKYLCLNDLKIKKKYETISQELDLK